MDEKLNDRDCIVKALSSSIRKKRRSIEMSQEKLAETVGVSRRTIARLEKGEITLLDLDLVVSIADALELILIIRMD